MPPRLAVAVLAAVFSTVVACCVSGAHAGAAPPAHSPQVLCSSLDGPFCGVINGVIPPDPYPFAPHRGTAPPLAVSKADGDGDDDAVGDAASDVVRSLVMKLLAASLSDPGKGRGKGGGDHRGVTPASDVSAADVFGLERGDGAGKQPAPEDTDTDVDDAAAGMSAMAELMRSFEATGVEIRFVVADDDFDDDDFDDDDGEELDEEADGVQDAAATATAAVRKARRRGADRDTVTLASFVQQLFTGTADGGDDDDDDDGGDSGRASGSGFKVFRFNGDGLEEDTDDEDVAAALAALFDDTSATDSRDVDGRGEGDDDRD